MNKIEGATSTFRLVSRIQSGDHDAFSLLFEKYSRRLLLILKYKSGDQLTQRISFQDLMQETFLRAYRDFDGFEYRGPGSFLHWLSKIADHVIADQARYQTRKKRRAVDLLGFRSASNPNGPEPTISLTPSRIYQGMEGLKKLTEALDSLPENYKQVLVLSKVHGCLTEEIAKHLGIPNQKAALLLHRALKRFREIYLTGQ